MRREKREKLMTDIDLNRIALLQSATQVLLDANLKLLEALRTYSECVGKENAQAVGGHAAE